MCEFAQTMMTFYKRFSSLSIFDDFMNNAQRGNTHRYTSPTAIAANYGRFFYFFYLHIFYRMTGFPGGKIKYREFSRTKNHRDPGKQSVKITHRSNY